MKNILCFLLVAFFAVSCNGQHPNVGLVSAKEFHEKTENKNLQLIDVRTPKEFKSGHIANAENIHLYDADFEERIEKLDKNKPVYVYCKSGGRSAEAADILAGKGFKVVELRGGIEAWEQAENPVKQ